MILVKILPLPLFVKTNYHFLKEKKGGGYGGDISILLESHYKALMK